jgi:hypothetical protein
MDKFKEQLEIIVGNPFVFAHWDKRLEQKLNENILLRKANLAFPSK